MTSPSVTLTFSYYTVRKLLATFLGSASVSLQSLMHRPKRVGGIFQRDSYCNQETRKKYEGIHYYLHFTWSFLDFEGRQNGSRKNWQLNVVRKAEPSRHTRELLAIKPWRVKREEKCGEEAKTLRHLIITLGWRKEKRAAKKRKESLFVPSLINYDVSTSSLGSKQPKIKERRKEKKNRKRKERKTRGESEKHTNVAFAPKAPPEVLQWKGMETRKILSSFWRTTARQT